MSEASTRGTADRSLPRRTVVIIPTYNEKDSLPVTLGRLRRAVPGADVLIVDDGSPDGTGEVADGIAQHDSAVNVMHRSAKNGLGAAYLAGFDWALERGYEVLVEMDADGSHRPEQLQSILDELETEKADLVLGSRWVPGGSIENWPRSREVISRVGNLYVKIMLGLGLGDATGGYRAYTADTLRKLDLGSVESQGYCFQVDMARRVVQSGGRVSEVPITFVERELGQSKMSRSIVFEALWRTTLWGVQHRTAQVRGLVSRGAKKSG